MFTMFSSSDFLFAVCKLAVSQRESIRQFLETDLRLEGLQVERLRAELRGGGLEQEVEEEVEFLTAVPAEKEKEAEKEAGRKRRRSGSSEPERNQQRKKNLFVPGRESAGLESESTKTETETRTRAVLMKPPAQKDSLSPRKQLPSSSSSSSSSSGAPRPGVGRPRKTSLVFPCSDCEERPGSRSALAAHRRKNHPVTDQSKPPPAPVPVPAAGNVSSGVQAGVQAGGEENLKAAEPELEETGAAAGETRQDNEEAEMTKMLLMDNEDSEDEDDMEILSETIIAKYDHFQVKLEPVEHSEEENLPASRVVSLMKKSKYFTENPNIFSVCSESEAASFPRDLRFLPGWRVKTMEVRRKTGEVAKTSYFLSPDQVQLLSGISVIEYLRVTGQSQQIIDLTTKKMKISQKTLQEYRQKYFQE